MSKNNQNWQNISQLPNFSTLLHKMRIYTLFKLELLKNGLSNPYMILDTDKEIVQRSARRLGILQENSLLINTEHETNLFFDYCIYEHKQEDLSGIQRSFKNFAKLYNKEWFEVFEIASQVYFAYLVDPEELRLCDKEWVSPLVFDPKVVEKADPNKDKKRPDLPPDHSHVVANDAQ